MGQRANIRRARRASNTEPHTEAGPGIDDAPEFAPSSLSQQVVALLMAVVLPLGGSWFLFQLATTPGKGEQVAPALAIGIGVLFGIPSLMLLYRHLRRVFG